MACGDCGIICDSIPQSYSKHQEVATERAWYTPRTQPSPLPYPETVPCAQALLAANRERVIWGTDWPHVMLKGAMPNDGALADVLFDWMPDAALREQVISRNPAKLYGF